jgi:WhiB family redox-sensing transcriptional regulator
MSQYLRTGGPIHGRTPRTETPISYRVPKPDVPDPNPGWQKRGACGGEDPELFFPISTVGLGAQRQIEVAKDVCRRCPVVDDCLNWALEANEQAGIWGGMSEGERSSLKRRVARQASKQVAA